MPSRFITASDWQLPPAWSSRRRLALLSASSQVNKINSRVRMGRKEGTNGRFWFRGTTPEIEEWTKWTRKSYVQGGYRFPSSMTDRLWEDKCKILEISCYVVKLAISALTAGESPSRCWDQTRVSYLCSELPRLEEEGP
ncbi:hypothetical protein RRG08_003506 [Elysia crispata]|uniref:Uncharacterized protein n=1 Tax=Elysia crispata TaxID=231223 RepID=A0AAE0Y6V7_9GAST|nr:hypothetical protein RRG08_003506 [Elysia crispata]